jgi:hypothetical protein
MGSSLHEFDRPFDKGAMKREAQIRDAQGVSGACHRFATICPHFARWPPGMRRAGAR